MKSINEQLVKETAIELIAKDKVTTTLDVKSHLRGLGYWANQEEVSIYLKNLADTGILSFTQTGPYRLYELGPTNPTIGDTDADSN